MGISSEVKFDISHIEGDFRSRSIEPSIFKGFSVSKRIAKYIQGIEDNVDRAHRKPPIHATAVVSKYTFRKKSLTRSALHLSRRHNLTGHKSEGANIRAELPIFAEC